MSYERRRQHHHVSRTNRSRQTAPSRRAAPAIRRRGGPPDRPGTVPAAHREVPAGRRRRSRPAPPTRRPPKKRVVRADPRKRARRTAGAGTPRWLTRFSAGQPRRRLISTLVAMLLILGAVLVRVGLLQTTAEGDGLRNAASQQWTRDRVLPAQRGTIFDRNGDELALSVPASTVAVNPQQVEDPAGTADTVAQILGLSPERRDELEAEMADKDRGFLYVARQIDDAPANQLAALNLTGVTIYREDRRTLPGGDTGRSVIGQTDIDGKGTSGIELQWDGTLSGTPGAMTVEVAPGDRSIPGSERVTEQPVAGTDLILTIDRSVQYAVEHALLKRVAELRARGAQAIVMDTDTGEVIAMASVRINDDGVYEITSGNYSAVDAYEPGSVGKVITVAGALNERTVTPQSQFLVPWQKQYTLRGDLLHDSHYHPDEMMDVEQILVESSNLGTISISETMGFERQYHYMREFGLGEKTALLFPGENPGILKPWQTWEGTEKFTVAYGQGVASSPIQLVTALNAIANDGVYVAPKLVMGGVDPEGMVMQTLPSRTHEAVRPRVAAQMQQMMRQVVCRGTATEAQVTDLSVAGKTGTGFIAQPDGGYRDAEGNLAYYASFVGFFPAEDPQATVLVSIDQPPGGNQEHYGGTAAAPVFRDLAPTIVHEMGIQPPPGSTGCEDE